MKTEEYIKNRITELEIRIDELKRIQAPSPVLKSSVLKPKTKKPISKKKRKKYKKGITKELRNFFEQHPYKKYNVKELTRILYKYKTNQISVAIDYLYKNKEINKTKTKGKLIDYYTDNQRQPKQKLTKAEKYKMRYQ